MQLFEYQMEALMKLSNGKVLNGGVGSGKSLTALSYYYYKQGGSLGFLQGGDYERMRSPKDLYIITTAMKRDKLEWEGEMLPFLLSTDPAHNSYDNTVVVDSWNNIGKYLDVRDAFFIFDEQRLVSYGSWSKNFLKVVKKNEWILLTGTPGDRPMDYLTLFLAHGFYRNKTEFVNRHVVYDPRCRNFPKIMRYEETDLIDKYRRDILIDMEDQRKTIRNQFNIYCSYNRKAYKDLGKLRWNPYKDAPIETPGELCQLWRRVCSEDEDRQQKLMELFEDHPKMIVFYNFNYERDILRECFKDYTFAEWNGSKHERVPSGKRWAYLVQYTAGCEGWNCITTDTIVFYSLNYSYKVMTQAAGRIDRINTPFTNLYYYRLVTSSPIDCAIFRALKAGKDFNERIYMDKTW